MTFTADLLTLVVWVEIPLLKIKVSFLINSPFWSYTVNATPALTGLLKNAVAPLLLPSTCEGIDKSIAWLTVILVNGCTSYIDIPHSLSCGNDVLYDPDSNLKSNTLAKPISFPGAASEFTPTLWSLRLKIKVLPIPIVGDL